MRYADERGKGAVVKYVANPVEVEAYQIVSVKRSTPAYQSGGSLTLVLENGEIVQADPGMTSRIDPAVGDYWVIQQDGYIYINPKEVFLRKYRPL